MVSRKGDLKRGWILVVEAEERIRYLLLAILSKWGYKVTVAGSGEEGLELFHKEVYNLVLSDLTMFFMDGWALARCIKAISPNTPVCLMTGWGKKEITAKMEGSAVDHVLFKPFKLHELEETVERMMFLKWTEEMRNFERENHNQ